jgi:hypothetical protein
MDHTTKYASLQRAEPRSTQVIHGPEFPFFPWMRGLRPAQTVPTTANSDNSPDNSVNSDHTHVPEDLQGSRHTLRQHDIQSVPHPPEVLQRSHVQHAFARPLGPQFPRQGQQGTWTTCIRHEWEPTAPNWHPTGTQLTPNWHPNGTQMAPKWHPAAPNCTPTSPQLNPTRKPNARICLQADTSGRTLCYVDPLGVQIVRYTLSGSPVSILSLGEYPWSQVCKSNKVGAPSAG